MTLAIAGHWFERQRIDDDITLLWEPYVVPLMRCNIWHVRGRDRDLMVDTGMGLASLSEAARDLLQKPVTAVATHSHTDHVGSHHEFTDVVAHPLEAPLLREPPATSLDVFEAFGEAGVAMLRRAGIHVDEQLLITALPRAGYTLESFATPPVPNLRLVEEGDVLDLGDRRFEVLHLPGHSPGSIGLWEARSGTLFSGDALYDGPLLDELPESSIADYLVTMERLLRLPVRVVHAGHDPSFDGARLKELALAYLEQRRPRTAAVR